MKSGSWPIIVCLVIIVLLLISCTQNLPETSPSVPPETSEPKPASFSVSDLNITPQEVSKGSAVTIGVLVTNIGGLSGTYEVTLKIDDVVEDTRKVTLAGGASRKVTFIKTKLIIKTYSVSINGQTSAFTVKIPTPPKPTPMTTPTHTVLISPPDNAVIETLTPELTWQKKAGADSYRVRVAKLISKERKKVEEEFSLLAVGKDQFFRDRYEENREYKNRYIYQYIYEESNIADTSFIIPEGVLEWSSEYLWTAYPTPTKTTPIPVVFSHFSTTTK